MKFPALFKPLQVGPYKLAHRVAMAPLTRMRAERESFAPRPLNVEYYGQRATQGGLIVAEASPVLSHGRGNPATPGIYSESQIAGWRKVVDAVHAKGGIIFLQLWHVGRVSHSSFHGGALPVSASAIPIKAEGMRAMTADGKIADYETPRALETEEVKDIVEAFRQGARNALAAGFDGVEIHGANGYLLDQFLRSGSNKRTDQYGDSLENRARLPLEVTKAVIEVWGGDRVGYRISPHFAAHSIADANPRETFSYLTKELNKTGLGYLHLIEAIGGRFGIVPPEARMGSDLRRIFERTFILNGGYDLRSGNEAIARGEADLIAFGVPFLANPDLPERLRQNAPLNEPDVATFYLGEAKGYTDYPSLLFNK